MILVSVFAALLFAYSLVSRRLERTVVTAPIVFTVAGAVTGLVLAGATLDLGREERLLIAEAALALLLFTDATRIGIRALAGNRSMPARLLSTGMLLTILLGAVAAVVVLRGLSVWEAGILAAVLAPTDAGLGQVIVNSPRVPARIREALSVEAGLNDGLAVPFMMFFIALALERAEGPHVVLVRFLGEQLGYGIVVGLGIGVAGGWLLERARRRDWMAASLRQLGLVALPVLCMLASTASGASMFIAAFVAGLAVRFRYEAARRHSVEFAEQWGQALSFFVFFYFGLRVAQEWTRFTPAVALYAVLSLTVVRMAPVAIALAGTGLSRPTVLFMGWFGPRGLASIVLGLVYLEHEARLPGEPVMIVAVMMTVLLSVLAHGLSASPGIALYADRLQALGPGAPEHVPLDDAESRAPR